MIDAYPLSWPVGFPRSKGRETSRFKVTLSGALQNVETSLRLFGKDSGKPVTGIVLSSNVTLGRQNPEDPGVAVWFTWENSQVCIPVDRYTSPAANLQAIHHVLEARRVELRHGTLALVRATFAGFKALPAPTNWTSVLGVKQNATRDEIEAAYRTKAKAAHPDAGGSTAAMTELNQAKAAALQSVSA